MTFFDDWWPSHIMSDMIYALFVYSAFHDTNHCKAALEKILSFYVIFRSRLLVVTVAEMYS